MIDKRPYDGLKHSASGFTLIELMVVVLLIGISSAMVIPRLAGALPGVRLKSSAREIAASLRYARSQAVTHQTPYAVVIDEEQQLLTIVPSDQESAGPRTASSSEAKYYHPPNSIRMIFDMTGKARPGPPQTALLFYASGASNGGRVALSDMDQRKYTVTVDAITGRTSIERL